MDYLHRTADELLSDLLDAFGAVLIEVPKWCGKTTTAEQLARSVIKMQEPDMQEEYLLTTQGGIIRNGEISRQELWHSNSQTAL